MPLQMIVIAAKSRGAAPTPANVVWCSTGNELRAGGLTKAQLQRVSEGGDSEGRARPAAAIQKIDEIPVSRCAILLCLVRSHCIL
jgi:hypothetical protein